MAVAQDPYALSDEDRLPWLEPVDEVGEEQGGGGVVRFIGLAVALLVILAIGIGATWWWQNREITPSGTGELIAAPAGPYRVKPQEEGGMKIEGQGDTAFATGEGADVQGSLDLDAVPEAAVERAAPSAPPVAVPAQKAGASASSSVSEGGRIVAKEPPAALAPEAPAGATIQLGAFPSQDSAKKTWESMAKRFAYLADRSQSIIKADVNGKTFYRLRVGTGSASEAKDICSRLRVAGENCLVVN